MWLQGAAIRQQVRTLIGKYDEIILDVGGRDSGALRAGLTVADAVLIPFQPRSVDLWAAGMVLARCEVDIVMAGAASYARRVCQERFSLGCSSILLVADGAAARIGRKDYL